MILVIWVVILHINNIINTNRETMIIKTLIDRLLLTSNYDGFKLLNYYGLFAFTYIPLLNILILV
jgi:hypothetical protein